MSTEFGTEKIKKKYVLYFGADTTDWFSFYQQPTKSLYGYETEEVGHLNFRARTDRAMQRLYGEVADHSSVVRGS